MSEWIGKKAFPCESGMHYLHEYVADLERQLKEAKEVIEIKREHSERLTQHIEALNDHNICDGCRDSIGFGEKLCKKCMDSGYMERKALQQQLQAANDVIRKQDETIQYWHKAFTDEMSKHNTEIKIYEDNIKENAFELTQLRQEVNERIDAFINQIAKQESRHEAENAQLRQELTQEGLDHNHTKQEVENLKDERDTLRARVRKLEKALKKIDEHDYHICNDWCFTDSIRIAKRALDGGKG